MSKPSNAESDWEDYAKEILAELDWAPRHGNEIAPGTDERTSWDDIVIPGRLLSALRAFNPEVPNEQLLQAHAEILSATSTDAITENYRVHTWITQGYRGISYNDDLGQEVTPTIKLVSTEPSENDWLAVNQVTVVRGDYRRRFDLVLYCNGMPVVIMELKKAGAQHADLDAAHAQLQTYLREFPLAFRFTVLTLISDGVTARYGTPFTPLNHYAPWNVDEDGKIIPAGATGLDGLAITALEQALHGLFHGDRFLQLTRNYVSFGEGDDGLTKVVAKPHQYFAVSRAIGSTVQAVESNGRAGVVWHTQGSGKSLEMEFYANLVMRAPRLLNPTIVVITDRRELDGQLFQAFNASLLLPEHPTPITTRAQLRDELSGRVTGGIYFTTLQKFGRTEHEQQLGADHPLLSDRRNIIVIVDEAHRSHYDDLNGYAWHLRNALPKATLIAFTGTPVSTAERNTRQTFGDYIDIYDLTRAVADGATVPVVFEPRLIKVGLASGVSQDDLDRAADEVTENLDRVERDRIEKSVAVINAVYGAPSRLATLAKDLLAHWDARSTAMLPEIEAPGKALVVSGTREIAARLYAAIITLRPEWHSDEISMGKIKVVYSGDASDKAPISKHVRRGSENDSIKARLKDVDDELQIVIVKDMMLTGFDSPPLHTLYLDRPLKGALLMQTLARVNRTFRGKSAGLLVGYAPVAENLQSALLEYSPDDQLTRPVGRDVSEAADLLGTVVAEIDALVAGFGWRDQLMKGSRFVQVALGLTNNLRTPANSSPQDPGPGNAVSAEEKSVGQQFRELSAQMARAWTLAAGSEASARLRPPVQFYEEVRVYMAKFDADDRRANGQPIPDEIARLLSNVIATHTVAGEVIDIYEAAGIPKPQLADLTPEFLAKAQAATNPQLAIEALRKTVLDGVATVTRNNLVRERAFSERITELMIRYTNSQLTAAEVIAELVELAKEVAADARRGEQFDPPLDHDQLAFYDTVASNESAVLEMGDDVLATIARELVGIMQRDVKTDWTVRDDVRAKLRSSIKRLLIKYDYPPDKQPGAVKLVLEQMELLAPHYAEDHVDGNSCA